MKEKPLIIFTTAYKNFEGFELEALDYLLKPIDFDRFTKAIHKALDYLDYKNSPKEESGESLEDYIRIQLENAKPVMTLMPMKKIG